VLGEGDRRGNLSYDRRSGEIRGVIDEGFPSFMREEAGVGDRRWWKEIKEEEWDGRENQLTSQNQVQR